MTNELRGLTLSKIEGMFKRSEKVVFVGTDEAGKVRRFEMYHVQDCCETVYLEDVNGDPEDLIGVPLLVSEQRSDVYPHSESGTWTFYTLRTIKGTVTLRWLGESNGWYTEDVSLIERDSVPEVPHWTDRP